MGARIIGGCARRCAIGALALSALGLLHCSGADETTEFPAAAGDRPAPAPTTGGGATPSGEDDPAPADDDAGLGDPSDDAAARAADGGIDTSKWFGAARCNGSGLAFCDSFEGTNVETNRWTIEKNGSNTVGIDTTQHARGAHALKLHFVGNTNFQYAWLSTMKPFDQTPALGTHVFGRMFYKVEKLPTKNMHWTSIEIDGPLNGANVRLRYGGEYDAFMANYVTGSGEKGKFSKTPFPIAKWVCLEWEYAKATSTMRLWADEQLLADIEVTSDPAWVHPKYDKLYVGWQNYQPNLVVPMNVWVDDVALDENRIGCAK